MERRRDSKDSLTNESLNKRFKSTFDLVNYAIRRAGIMIASGHAPRSHLNHELNLANAILDEITEGRDHLESTSEIAASDEAINGAILEDSIPPADEIGDEER